MAIKRRVLLLAVTFVGVLTITLALLEATLRLAPSLYDRLLMIGGPDVDFWQRYFLRLYQDRAFLFGKCHTHHATRGWTLRPNSHEVLAGKEYTINEHGFRSLTAYRDDPRRFKVMIVGDSITFGADADDRETWPYLLQQRAPELNVINLGVGGYGLDQMYITLVEEIDKYRPDLVIAAYIHDDLYRTLLSFRDYLKPRFYPDGDDLVLTNVPIGDPVEVYRRLTTERTWELRSLKALATLISGSRGLNGAPARKIGFRLVRKMRETAEAKGAEFVLLNLACQGSLTDLQTPDFGEAFLRDCRDRLPGLKTIETRRVFWAKRTGTPWGEGHYTRRESAVVGELVSQQIRTLSSWRRFDDGTRARVAAAPPAGHGPHPIGSGQDGGRGGMTVRPDPIR
jgi:hypothetical protein